MLFTCNPTGQPFGLWTNTELTLCQKFCKVLYQKLFSDQNVYLIIFQLSSMLSIQKDFLIA